MREIKFRAWNKKDKIMVYDNEDNSSGYWDGVYCSNIKMVNNQFQWSKYEWMEYVGLKDKNNKEIYEGDILKADWGYYDDIRVVELDTFYYALLECTVSDNIEVIGNIYETPELLNK